MGLGEQVSTEKGKRLDSWKSIAEYLQRDTRSVQRWEKERGLPVHRVPGEKGGTVFAYPEELDNWLRGHPRNGDSSEPSEGPSIRTVQVSSDRADIRRRAAAVRSVAASLPAAEVEAEGEVRAPKSAFVEWRSRKLFLTAVSAVLVLACVVYVVRRFSHPQPARARIMLAVLPFMNLSGDSSQDYFADGLTEEMITDLGRLNPQALGVIARTSAMKYKNTNKDIAQIGRELGVTYILEGSVRREGKDARVSAQLIQVSDQTHVWAQSYELQVKDILSVQRDVAATIADKIQINLNGGQWARLSPERTANPDAYDDYLRGRYAWNRRSIPEFPKAVAYFNQAIAKDPNFALAYAGLADTYTLMSLNGMGSMSQLLSQAKATSLKALALDDGLAAAHTSLAAVKVLLDWDWAGAENEFHRALDLNPNYAPAHHWYGNLLLSPLGRHDEAIAELKRAQDLDPMSLIINTDLGYAYYLKRQNDIAFAQYQRVVAMDATFVPVHYYLFKYYYHAQKYDAAVQEAVTDARLSGRADLAQEEQRLFATGGFRKVMQEQAARQISYPTSFCGAAEMHAAIAENETALANLELCYKAREPGLVYLKVDPVWDSLHAEPRFQALEHRVGLQ
jgi:TolB-like protein/Tfp pilus assembly protein PilF